MAAKRKATKKASKPRTRAKKASPPLAVEVLEEAAYAVPRVRPGFFERLAAWLMGKA